MGQSFYPETEMRGIMTKRDSGGIDETNRSRDVLHQETVWALQ